MAGEIAGVGVNLDTSLAGNFARVAAARPDAIAVAGSGWEPTFCELDAAASGLARGLAGLAIGERVALWMEHDAPLVAAVVAVAKAGCIGVVLNPTDPLSRLRQIVEDAGPAAIVADEAHASSARNLAGATMQVLVAGDWLAGGLGQSPARMAPAGAPAFLTYTSGSSGRPKGVVRSHRHLAHNAHRQIAAMGLRPSDRLVVLASLSGGLGLALVWCALLGGATACPFPVITRGFTGLAAWLDATRATVLPCSSSVFRRFVQTLGAADDFPHIRIVRLASERASAVDFQLFQRWFRDDCVLLHTLSSSEAGNIAQIAFTKRDSVEDGVLPVGFPVEGVRIRLVDEAGEEVPTGVVGEVVVTSRYLSSGYWRNEALTAQCFHPAPGGEVEYRSGDRARRNAAGQLVFAGRSDARAKIHGLLVEPAEVEDALGSHELVERAVVLADSEGGGEPRLVAHVVPRIRCDDAEGRLREALRAALPGPMMPSAFVFHEELPLTPHGKIDRARLVAGDAALPIEPAPPLTPTERALAVLWSEALGGRPVGRTDAFSSLGGDSLSAAVVAAKLPSTLGTSVAFGAFVDHPTVAAMAAHIDRLLASVAVEPAPRLPTAPRDAAIPASFQQQQCYRYCADPESAAGYSMSSWYELRGPLDAGKLQTSLDEIVRRHHVFRTTFLETPQGLVQVVRAPSAAALDVADLRNSSMPRAEAERIFAREADCISDARREPLLRFMLLILADELHWLLRMNSHINSDGWTWAVFLRELAVIYDSLVRGRNHGLPEPPQYADYARWQQTWWAPGSTARLAVIERRRRALENSIPPPPLPFQQRCSTAQPEDGHVHGRVAREVSLRLDEVARGVGATPYAAWLGLFAALLSVETGCDDFLIGSYIADRPGAETMDMIGFLAHLTVVRVRGTPAMCFVEWTAEAQRSIAEAQDCVGLTHEEVAADLASGGHLLPPVRLIFRQVLQVPGASGGGVAFVPSPTWGYAACPNAFPWEFTLTFIHDEGGNRCAAHFDPRLHNPRGVQSFVDAYAELLDRASSNPRSPVHALIPKRRSFARALGRLLAGASMEPKQPHSRLGGRGHPG